MYDKRGGKETRIPFQNENKFGSIYSMAMKDLDINRYSYNFYDGDEVFTDPYAKVIHGHEKWGKCEEQLRGGFISQDYDWEADKPLKIPYENSILYGLNVRAFTKHKSSGVPHKGTFRGIIDKIPHLKELGISAIELMPAYEFNEIENKKDTYPVSHPSEQPFLVEPLSELELKYNCWGYTKGFYFAPKAAYAYDKDSVKEFKDMVKELHRNGIEVIMQFYFPNSVKMGMILDAVKYWVLKYIDGIHLKRTLRCRVTTERRYRHQAVYYDFPVNRFTGKMKCRNIEIGIL